MTAPAKLFVSVANHSVWIRIAGRANFTSSIDFNSLVSELWKKGFHHFIIDLSECALMDSTFLGVLAGLGLKANAGAPTPSDQIELLNANARIAELLESLGAVHLFKMATGQLPVSVEEIPASEHSKIELKRACLEGHTTLMELSPENVPKFKDITVFLAEDLKKLQSDQ
jgi:anti-sigma B factor antagonist